MTVVGGKPGLLVLVGLIFLAGCAGTIPGDPASSNSDTTAESPIETANGTLEIHYINVGQSVSTLIISPDGETMLVDTGHNNDDGEYVLDYLQRQDITRIDHLVVSHNDADHMGGNAAVIEYFESNADGIGAVYDPGIAASTQTYGEYLDTVEEHGVTLYRTREGDSVSFGEVDVDVLGPPEPYLENEARNENSIVLKLTHGETSFLLSGDAEDDQEAYLVDTYGSELRSTVLKAGHHGSSSSSSELFLDAVDPQAVVISSAYDSRYGHPTEAVLERFADRSIPAYWTATHGTTVLESDASGVTVETQREAPNDPLAIRDGESIPPGTSGDVVKRIRLGGESVEDDSESDDETDDTAEETNTSSADHREIVEVATINADAEGDDQENLNNEYVVFENTGEEAVDLSGWTVEDEVGQSYEIPDGFTLEAGATVTLRTGSGTDTDTDLYWGSGSPIWNNGGDTVILSDDTRDQILEVSYQ